MKRKVTALLLAMAFVLATVAPTLAASGTGKNAEIKTATVSVEKSRSKWKPLGAVVKLLAPKKEDTETKEAPKEEGTEAKPEGSKEQTNNPQSEKPSDQKDQPAEGEHKIKFSLRNKSNEALSGAEFTVKSEDESKQTDKKLVTEKTPVELKLKTGKYTLTKTKDPEGYVLPSEMKFEVAKDGKVTITGDEKALTFNQEENLLIIKAEKQGTKTLFSLQDIFGNELKGGTLQIKEKDAEKEKWTSGETAATYTLEEGTYEFVQKAAPTGYEKADPIKFTIDENGDVTADKAHLKTVGDHKVLIMKNDFEKAKVFYSIRDIADNELAGAKLRIAKTDGTFTKVWTSGKTPKDLDLNLEEGDYRLELMEGPAGYDVAKAVDFTIRADGNIEADKDHLKALGKHQIIFLAAEHEESNAYFALRDILGRELAGGALQIRDRAKGEVVKEWTSGSAPKGFRLDAGEYTLVQAEAPKGYTLARSVDFEITTDGKIIADVSHLKLYGDRQVLALVNAYKSNMVEFSKVTPEGKALSGASLEVYKNTTKLASWTSDANGYKMEFEPGTYRFHEAAAPQGYKPVSDFEFDVKADGTITLGTIQNGETVALKDGRIIVTDQVDKAAPKENKPEANKNKVQNYWVEFDVAKKDGTLLDGAIVEIYQNGKVLESWTTSASGYKTKLQPGSYRFHTKTAPKGYRLARDFNFAVNRDGSITLGKLQSGDTVTAKDRKITVYGDPVSATGARTTTGTNGKKGNGKLPKTGDGVSPVIYAVGIAAVGAIVLGIGMKKRRESVDEIK